MKLQTIKVIKQAFAEREGVIIEKIKTNDSVNSITAYRDDKEVVFIKENHSGGTYTTFDLTEEDVADKIDAYAIEYNFKRMYTV